MDNGKVSEPDLTRWMGWYEPRGQQFYLNKPLSGSEWDRALHVNRLLQQALERWNYRVVAKNFSTLQGVLRHLARRKGTWGRDAGLVPLALTTVLSALSNYLGSGRTYLDVTQSSWTRQHGGGSPQMKLLERATAEEFDSNFGYRFTYKLRNLIQHVELRGLSLKFDADDSGTGLHPIWAERDQLLATYDWGGILKKDLRSLPPTFDIYPLLAEGFEGFRRIEEAVTDEMLQWALPELPWMVDQVETLPLPPDSIPLLLTDPSSRTDPASGMMQFEHSSMLPPTDMRRILTAIQKDDLASLRIKGLPPVPAEQAAVIERCIFAGELVSPSLLGDISGTTTRIAAVLNDPNIAGRAIGGLVELVRLLLAEQAILMGETPISVLERYTSVSDETQ